MQRVPLPGSNEIRPRRLLFVTLVVLPGWMGWNPAQARSQETPAAPDAAYATERPATLLPGGTPGPTLWPVSTGVLRTVTALDPGIPYAGPRFDIQNGPGGMSGWKKGLLWGGVIGAGTGILAFLFVDQLPCDTCSGTGSDSFADGAFLEFTLLFGAVGAGIGALIGGL